jgi:hypothetical protein
MKLLLHTILLLLLSCLFLVTCKKEVSCENCRESKNIPPLARAGADQRIILPTDSLLLDGSASLDTDGSIVSYRWINLAGPSSPGVVSADSAKTMIKGLGMGVYRFELTVKDNGGLLAKDTMQVLVDNLAVNQPPVACAGIDQAIILPINTVNLDGSCSADPENTILGYEWKKVAGPSSYTIVTPSGANTAITALAEGIYQFELKVTDAGGLFDTDTVQIFVQKAIVLPVPPVCGDTNRPQVMAHTVPFGTLSYAKSTAAVAAAGTKIVFAGGQADFIPDAFGTKRVDIYDVVTKTWSTAELSTPRWGIAAVVAGNKIFFAGGQNGDGSFDTFYASVDIYDVSTNTWTVAALSEPRSQIAAAAVGTKVLFAGGEKNFNYECSNTVDIYDLSTNSWSTTTLSEPRSYITAVTHNNKIYFGGGTSEDRWHTTSAKIDIYDNATNGWSVAALPEPKAMMAGTVVGNKIHWAGGIIGSGAQTSSCKVEIQDVATGTFSTAYLSRPRHWVASTGNNAVVKDNKIVYFSHDWVSPSATNFDIYNLTTGSWSIGVFPQGLQMGSIIISANNEIYLAGKWGINPPTNGVAILKF